MAGSFSRDGCALRLRPSGILQRRRTACAGLSVLCHSRSYRIHNCFRRCRLPDASATSYSRRRSTHPMRNLDGFSHFEPPSGLGMHGWGNPPQQNPAASGFGSSILLGFLQRHRRVMECFQQRRTSRQLRVRRGGAPFSIEGCVQSIRSYFGERAPVRGSISNLLFLPFCISHCGPHPSRRQRNYSGFGGRYD